MRPGIVGYREHTAYVAVLIGIRFQAQPLCPSGSRQIECPESQLAGGERERGVWRLKWHLITQRLRFLGSPAAFRSAPVSQHQLSTPWSEVDGALRDRRLRARPHQTRCLECGARFPFIMHWRRAGREGQGILGRFACWRVIVACIKGKEKSLISVSFMQMSAS